jgi:hypothetical protein
MGGAFWLAAITLTYGVVIALIGAGLASWISNRISQQAETREKQSH